MGIARWSVVLSLLWPVVAIASEATFAWPEGRRAAVNLAYDDALDSQLDHAIPALDRHGFKGTFYLTLGSDVVRARMPAWRDAARNGHELGNHTLFHACSARGEGREWVTPEHDLGRITVAQLREQVMLGNAMLHAIDGSAEFTFTAPCGDRMAADGDYIEAIADEFLGIKLMGGVVGDMAALDLAATPVVVPVGATGAELIALVEEAGRKGTMVGFTFHGIGGDHLQVSIAAHDELLAYLARHRDVYWVDTFRNQMRWVRARRDATGRPAAD